MSKHPLGDVTAQELEGPAWTMRPYSAPDATSTARAAVVLAGIVKPTCIGLTASNALAAAVTASTAARSIASRPPGDATRYNPSYRASEPFQHAGSTPLASILDNLEGDAMQAMVTAMTTRLT